MADSRGKRRSALAVRFLMLEKPMGASTLDRAVRIGRFQEEWSFKRRSIVRHPCFLALLSGGLLGTSFIPFPPWAIFFCYVPLWLAWLDEPSWKRILWTGWLAQFVGTLIGFNWVAYTAHSGDDPMASRCIGSAALGPARTSP